MQKSSRLYFQTHADRVNPCYSNLGILAMTAVNEIVYKNCVPQDLESFLLSMFNNAFQLMQAVVQEPAEGVPPRLDILDDT